MANTTYVSAVNPFLVEDVEFNEHNHSIYRLFVPLLLRLNRDRSFDYQPEHMHWVSASVAIHSDDRWECGAFLNFYPPGIV